MATQSGYRGLRGRKIFPFIGKWTRSLSTQSHTAPGMMGECDSEHSTYFLLTNMPSRSSQGQYGLNPTMEKKKWMYTPDRQYSIFRPVQIKIIQPRNRNTVDGRITGGFAVLLSRSREPRGQSYELRYGTAPDPRFLIKDLKIMWKKSWLLKNAQLLVQQFF